MKTRIKRKWLKALRGKTLKNGGPYKKARGFLHKKDSTMCCLGVLCDLYHKETGKGAWEVEPFSPKSFFFLGLGGSLPDAVRRWAGLSFEEEQELIEINDKSNDVQWNKVIPYIERIKP